MLRTRTKILHFCSIQLSNHRHIMHSYMRSHGNTGILYPEFSLCTLNGHVPQVSSFSICVLRPYMLAYVLELTNEEPSKFYIGDSVELSSHHLSSSYNSTNCAQVAQVILSPGAAILTPRTECTAQCLKFEPIRLMLILLHWPRLLPYTLLSMHVGH